MDVKTSSPRANRLICHYGELLSVEDLVRLFRFPSTDALRQARLAGRLPVKLFRLPGRRTLYASTVAVAEVLDRAEQEEITREQNTQEEPMK